MLLSLIKNETIKILKRGKTWIVFILFILTAIAVLATSIISEKNMIKYNSPEYKISMEKDQLDWINKDIQNAENEIKSNNDDKQAVKKAELHLESLKDNKLECENRIKELEEKIKSGNKSDWKEETKLEIKNLEEEIKNDNIPERYKAKQKKHVENLKYQLENNIKPIEPWEVNGQNYILSFIGFLGSGILIIGISLFMSDIVSGECTPATFKFLLTQPISRGKILFSKLISVILVSLSMILGVELVFFLGVGLTKGFMPSTYLMNYGTKYQFDLSKIVDGTHPLMEVANSGSMIGVNEFVLKALLLQILFIITCCVFVFMISTLFKSSMITMAASISFIIFFTAIMNIVGKLKQYAQYFFITYGDSVALLKSNLVLYYNNININISIGVITMIATIVICYLIAHINFIKKDMLI